MSDHQVSPSSPGQPVGGHEYAAESVRVLKAHRDAARQALAANLRLLQDGDLDQACANIAEAVITALDTKVSYVVLVVDGSTTHPVLVYGTYASAKTAKKASETGAMGTAPGARLLGIYPILKAPRRGQ